jgi:cyclase
MLAKRIIPCLDVKAGRTVKGTNFVDLRDAGDAVELARVYSNAGADELVFLDIAATNENRSTLIELVCRVAREINIPFTVGGGIRTVDDISALLQAGADKVSINSAALKDPELLSRAAENFGSQCVVLAIDAKRHNDGWLAYLNGARQPTEIDAVKWARRATELGAGEILLTSIDADGTKEGFDIELTSTVSAAVNLPVIASGGGGTAQDFADIFQKGGADAALAASVFHFGEIDIRQLKQFIHEKGITVRI